MTLRYCILALVAAALFLIARPALAHECGEPTPAPSARAKDPEQEPRAAPPTPEERRWYGWQTLIADGTAVLVTTREPLAGLGVYTFGGPLVHLVHGRPGVAAASSWSPSPPTPTGPTGPRTPATPRCSTP